MEKKYTIAVVKTDQKRWSYEGNVEVVVEKFSTRMAKLGHQVTCYNWGSYHERRKEFDGAKLHEYP